MVRCHLVLDLSPSPLRSGWCVLDKDAVFFALVKIKQEAFTTDLRVSVGLTVHVHICLTAQTVQSEMLCGHTSSTSEQHHRSPQRQIRGGVGQKSGEVAQNQNKRAIFPSVRQLCVGLKPMVVSFP